MGLAQALSKVRQRSVVEENKVTLLLVRLQDSEDLEVLDHALRDTSIPSTALTRALRREYGAGAVEDASVDIWRDKHLQEVTGL